MSSEADTLSMPAFMSSAPPTTAPAAAPHGPAIIPIIAPIAVFDRPIFSGNGENAAAVNAAAPPIFPIPNAARRPAACWACISARVIAPNDNHCRISLPTPRKLAPTLPIPSALPAVDAPKRA